MPQKWMAPRWDSERAPSRSDTLALQASAQAAVRRYLDRTPHGANISDEVCRQIAHEVMTALDDERFKQQRRA